MSIAQGINKTVAMIKQTGLGVPKTGTGAQLMRRETAIGKLAIATFDNKEIASHQQGTGSTQGLRSSTYALNGVLSPNTYSTLFASILRKLFTATAPITATGVTIGAAVSGVYPVTIATGSYLTSGFKVGDVMRLSVGALGAANINKNLLIVALTATIASVKVLNGSTLTAEGPIAGCTLTVIGKKSIAPITAQTQEYWTIEDWQSDISISEYFTDMVVGGIDVGLPSTGNVTFACNFAGLDRTSGGSQILTTPTAESTTPVITAVQGAVILNGLGIANITAASIKIDTGAANMGGVIGAVKSPDVQRGRINVSGQFTAFYQDGVMPAMFEEGTVVNLVIVVAVDQTAASDFVSFNMSAVTLNGDDKDDGEKGIIRTYPFVARINTAGGALLANDKTILSIQDSLAA